jgi:hypothetical protein
VLTGIDLPAARMRRGDLVSVRDEAAATS